MASQSDAENESEQPTSTVNQTPSNLNLEGVYRQYRANPCKPIQGKADSELDAPSFALSPIMLTAGFAHDYSSYSKQYSLNALGS